MAREVKDTSLRLPHGERGKVVDIRTFTRKEHRDLPAGVEQMVRVSVAQRRKLTEGDKMAGRHGNKGVISKVVPIEDMPFLEDGTPIDIILNPLGVPGRMNIGQILETHLGWAAFRLGFRAVTPVFDGAHEAEIQADLARSYMIDRAWNEITTAAWNWLKEYGYDPDLLEDDNEVRNMYIEAWLGQNEKYDRDRLTYDDIYAHRAVLAEWLEDKGYDSESILAFEDDPRPYHVREEVGRNATKVGLILWLEEMGYEVSEDLSLDDLIEQAGAIQAETLHPMPVTGKQLLFDGRTGEAFDRPVTVGVIHMLKLSHLVEDKVHARSTGPYSLVTQQPLGGKAQFGGQRLARWKCGRSKLMAQHIPCKKC